MFTAHLMFTPSAIGDWTEFWSNIKLPGKFSFNLQIMPYEINNARYLFSCQGSRRRPKKRPKSPNKDPRSSLPRHKVKKSPEVLKGQRVIGRNKVDGFHYAGMCDVLILHKCMYH